MWIRLSTWKSSLTETNIQNSHLVGWILSTGQTTLILTPLPLNNNTQNKWVVSEGKDWNSKDHISKHSTCFASEPVFFFSLVWCIIICDHLQKDVLLLPKKSFFPLPVLMWVSTSVGQFLGSRKNLQLQFLKFSSNWFCFGFGFSFFFFFFQKWDSVLVFVI